MTDTERIDWLQAAILDAAGTGHAAVVLGAWFSKPGDVPDGYSVSVGELIVDMDEHPSLRDAIDDAAERARVA